MAMSIRINPFMQYAASLSTDVPAQENELKSLIVENIQAIATNALNPNFICSSDLWKVRHFNLNLKNLRFVPPEVSLSSYLPQTARYYLGYPEISSDNCHYEDFLVFIASSIPDLVNLQIEESTFPNYFLKNYQALNMGLTYLSESFRRSKQVTAEKSLSAALETLNIARNCFKLIAQENNSLFLLEKTQIFKILDMQAYAPLKKLMGIGKTRGSKGLIDEIFGNELLNFFTICMKMKPAELKAFCISLSFLDSDEANKKDLLFMLLFKYVSFIPMRDFLTVALLRPKNSSETAEQFAHRENCVPVKTAITYVRMKINQLKTPKNAEELLSKYFNVIENDLQFYKPFQESFNFIFHHRGTPKIENYIGLPFTQIGMSDYTKLIVNVWRQAEDLNEVTLTTPKGRRILLEASEFLFLEGAYSKQHLDSNKTIAWAAFFPEIYEFPEIVSAIEAL